MFSINTSADFVYATKHEKWTLEFEFNCGRCRKRYLAHHFGNILTSVGSIIDAASSNIIPSLSSNSTQPPKPLPGSRTFLTVTTNVNGGTRNLQDFTVTVSGNGPSPRSFSG